MSLDQTSRMAVKVQSAPAWQGCCVLFHAPAASTSTCPPPHNPCFLSSAQQKGKQKSEKLSRSGGLTPLCVVTIDDLWLMLLVVFLQPQGTKRTKEASNCPHTFLFPPFFPFSCRARDACVGCGKGCAGKHACAMHVCAGQCNEKCQQEGWWLLKQRPQDSRPSSRHQEIRRCATRKRGEIVLK